MNKSISVALAALTVFTTATPALAFNPQPDPPGRWAQMALVASQTARLSVMALPVAQGAMPASCTVTLNFLDGDGNKMIETTTMVLIAGKARFVDMSGSVLRLSSAQERAQFRAAVEVLRNPPAYLPCSGVAATVEVFDATGRTSVMVVHPVQF